MTRSPHGWVSKHLTCTSKQWGMRAEDLQEKVLLNGLPQTSLTPPATLKIHAPCAFPF